jgi:hypothetical protein
LNFDLNFIWISPLTALGFTEFFCEKEFDIVFLIGNKAALLEIFLKLRLPYSAANTRDSDRFACRRAERLQRARSAGGKSDL